MAKINLHVEAGTVSGKVTVDEYLASKEGDRGAWADIMSKFALDDNGEPLPFDEARALIGRITVDDLDVLITEFNQMLLDAASPS